MKYCYFLGWDCGKSKLNYCLRNVELVILEEGEVSNNARQIKALLLKLARRHQLELSQILQCVDNTGLYSNPILSLLSEMSLAIWLEDPLQISRSIGRKKDKNDILDARDHAEYAMTFQRRAKLYKLKSQIVEKLKMLTKQRLLLVRNRQRALTSYQETLKFTLAEVDDMANKILEDNLAHSQRSIDDLDKHINELIASDREAKRKYDITRSAPGFGPKNTIVILSVTEFYEKLTNAQSCASYGGVSPHERQSGSSIRQRHKTSRAIDNELKTALHQGAMSLIRSDSVYKRLYDRLREKGKSHLSAINAVRNKMLRVLYACLRDDVMYEKNFHESFAI